MIFWTTEIQRSIQLPEGKIFYIRYMIHDFMHRCLITRLHVYGLVECAQQKHSPAWASLTLKAARKKMHLKMSSAEVDCCKKLPNITD